MNKATVMSLVWTLGIVVGPSVLAAEEPGASRIVLDHNKGKGQLRILIDGKEALVYCHGKDLDLPHFYPVRSPTGQSMTVQYPSKFPHHRSFWFADKVQLSGKRSVEFYGALYSSEAGRNARKPPFRDHVRHVEFAPGKVAGDRAEIAEKLIWEMDGDVAVLDEHRRMRIVALGSGEYLLDVTFTITASYGDVRFVSDAVHYAWPYIRMNSEFSVEGGGVITNSEGGQNQGGTHNKVAKWVDYSNTVDDQTSGLTIFSHSDNAGPHKWLTRDYGCFGPRRPDVRSGKPFTLKQGDSLSRRVGVLVHRGNVKTGQVAERYQQYVEGKP